MKKRIRIHVRFLWNPCLAAFDGSEQDGHNAEAAAMAINQLAGKDIISVTVKDK